MIPSLLRRAGSHHATACPLFALSLLPLMLAAQAASAALVLPTGGRVVAGSAWIGAPSAGSLTVRQSSRKAILDWSGFSIGKGGEVTFDNGSGATLNRVTGSGVSSLDGLLSGTGSVYVINPNGVIVGRSGVVRTGGSFVASALDTSDAGFLSGGPLSFAGSSKALVVNYGRIGSLGGDVALVAPRVVNDGTISAARGDAGLLAGYRVTLTDASLDQGRFSVALGGADTSASNAGVIRAADAELRAEGGSVYALAGDTRSVIRATGVKSGGGKVWLVAEGGTTEVAGRIEAGGAGGTAGAIETSGEQVKLGKLGVDAHGGTWTVDPDDLTIDATAATSIDQALANGTSVTEQTTASGTSGLGTVTTSGNGDIVLAAPIAWTTSATLTLSAYRNIDIDAAVSLSKGTLDLTAGTGNTGAVGPSTGAIAVNAPIAVTGAGAVNLAAASDTQTVSGVSILELSFALGSSLGYGTSSHGGTLSIDGAPYTLVYTMAQLAKLNGSTGDYALATPLTAPTSAYSAAVISSFGGTLEGLGQTLSNLTIEDSTPADNVGLVGTLNMNGVIRDLGLVGGSITATGDGSNVGGLVGYSGGNSEALLADIYSTAAVTEAQTGDENNLVGGLGGLYGGIVVNSFSGGVTTGSTYNAAVGGAVGDLIGGRVIDVYSYGSVVNLGGGPDASAAGIVGSLGGGNASDIYAAGEVTGASGVVTSGIATGSGTVNNGYTDCQTTGQRSGFSGTRPGLTTRQLQSSLPSGFSSTVWGQVPGRTFPYLLNFFPTGTTPQVLSGRAFGSMTGVALKAVAVDAVLNGSSPLGSTVSGANGYWYMLLPQGSLPVGSTVTAYLDGATSNGAPVYANAVAEDITDPRGQIEMQLYGDSLTVHARASTDTLSSLEQALGSALGPATTAAGPDILFSDPAGTLALDPGASLAIHGTIRGFVFDRNLDLGTGELRLASSGGFSQVGSPPVTTGRSDAAASSGITASALLGVVTGAVDLGSSTNHIGALGPWTGRSSLTLVTDQGLTVSAPVTSVGDVTLTATGGDIATDAAITAPVLTLDASASALSEDTTTGAIAVGTLNATAADGIVLTSPANQIGAVGTNSPGTGPDQITQ